VAARSRPSLATLSVRERRVLAIGGAIAAVLFVLAVVWPLERGVARARREVAHQSAELTWMRRVAPELAAAGAPSRAPASLPLIVLIDQSAHQAGLGTTLAGSTPSGSGALGVQLQHAPFDQMVAWLARLQQRSGVEVTAARIESSGAPGLVNASLDLKRP
jgi:type II secretory pathway component PulM